MNVETGDQVLQVKDLSVVYKRRRGVFMQNTQHLYAVNKVSFTIERGKTLGLVGESGSGKSTVAQAITGLAPIDSGSIVIEGKNIAELKGSAIRKARSDVQMVFQDPYSSLDPSMSIRSSLLEPLRVHMSHLSNKEKDERIQDAIVSVGLRVTDLRKYPHEFSGGQRQRIAIARAIITNPSLIVLDEAVSALDVSTRAQILTLLDELQKDRGLSYLFIGHDLAVVQRMSDNIAVMYLGEIVESGPSDTIISEPQHPYTGALIASIPDVRGKVSSERSVLVSSGRNPDAWNRPQGCAYASRCPFAMDICRESNPQDTAHASTPLPEGGTQDAWCHFQTGEDRPKSLHQILATSQSEVSQDGDSPTLESETVTHE